MGKTYRKNEFDVEKLMEAKRSHRGKKQMKKFMKQFEEE